MLFFPDNPPVCWNGRITSKTILVPFFCFCDAIKWKHYQNMPSLGIFIITTKSRNSITYQANFCLNILKQTLEGPWRNLLLSWLQAKTIACHWLLWTGGKKKKKRERRTRIKLDLWCVVDFKIVDVILEKKKTDSICSEKIQKWKCIDIPLFCIIQLLKASAWKLSKTSSFIKTFQLLSDEFKSGQNIWN